ncbi:MAG: Na+/H+ antiporter, partial [Myxococcaceae bacterium]|nr:Na+/H+ antiporter [Myxococcaceae bacterium]
LEDLLATGLVSRKDHAERRAELQRQVIEAEVVLRARPDEPGLDPHVEVSLLTAQKAALTDAARRGLVDNEAAEHLIAQLDRQLLGTKHHEQDD